MKNQPIAIVHGYLPSGWERIYECTGPATLAYVVRWLRECDRRFYIEWLDTATTTNDGA